MMKEYKRKYPSFSLCGLNCCLCPRFHTEGSSKCPGCGGVDFSVKHPACAVITCNRKHDDVEFCFECSVYPCARYEKTSQKDSFISYKNVLKDQAKARESLESYLHELNNKERILSELIAGYNDGKSKGFYCLAVNLLPVSALEEIMHTIKEDSGLRDLEDKEKAKKVVGWIRDKAEACHIDLILRK